MDHSQVSWIANCFWGIANAVLWDLDVRGKCRDVIPPMTALRRLDSIPEPRKSSVLDMTAQLDLAQIDHQDAALRQAAGQTFHNTSKFTLRDLKARAGQQRLNADFEANLDGFSPNVQDIKAELDPRRGLYGIAEAGQPAVVAYEADTELCDREQVPLLEEGGVEAFLGREVLPHAPDARYEPESVRLGHEISFARYFYQPQPMRTLEGIRADILGLETGAEGLLAEFIGGPAWTT